MKNQAMADWWRLGLTIVGTVLLCVLLISGVSWFSWKNQDTIPQSTEVITEPLKPQRLEVPSLGVSARVVSVGLAADGQMDTPPTWDVLAWYQLGPKPGEEGQAVIAGHFDSDDGSPAVFADLHRLVPGDRVYITDNNRVRRSFSVLEVKEMDKTPSSVEEVFGFRSGKYLNLVTCSGDWDAESQQYSHRWVVFTELKTVEKLSNP